MNAFEKRTRVFDLDEHVVTRSDEVAPRPEPVAV